MSAGDVIAASPVVEPEPDTTARTRSVWASQLLLAAVVVVVALIVQALAPEQFATWQFATGVAAIVVVTAVSLAMPWQRLPRGAILALPMLDIVAIGLMAHGSAISTGFLWVFPVVWIATHFGLAAMLTGGALICLLMLVDAVSNRDDEAAVGSLLIVLLSLTFLTISTALTTRQTRAFQTLLRRQAGKLQETVTDVRAQGHRIRFLLDSVDLGIVRVAPDGRVLTVNDTYLSLYGLDPDRPGEPGRSVEYSSLRGEPLPPHRRPLARAAAGEPVEDELVWLFDAEGAWRAVAVSIRPLPPTTGEEASTLLMVREVTALIESQLARDRIATIVSHELRNPLTAVLGHAELLAEDDTLPERAREQVRVIEAASHRMRHLIEEILAHPHDGSSARLVRTPIDLRRIVGASVASFQPVADAGGVTVHVDAPRALPAVGDAFRLRQVVDNLLSNAIKYTPPGGGVTVRGEAADGVVRIAVVDEGVGIAAADLERVFDPYFRAATARASGVGGTGLGMGIARSIVESHGGRLELTSEQGVGTTVTVTVPVEG
ncbi:sensor histidine kinase [Microbacterium sp. GXF7504]